MPALKMRSGSGGSSRRRGQRSPTGSRNGIKKSEEGGQNYNGGEKSNVGDFECKNYGTRPEPSFGDHFNMSKRISKSLYFAQKLPSTPRPSLPLTVLAVKSFTTQVLGNADTLEFLDLEMASEIGRNACITPTALIMALVYLERLSTHNPNYLSSVKPSELFVVSLLVASKFIQDEGEDSGIYNDEWATSSQIHLKELNKLELQFLDAINWNVSVKRDEFDKVLTVVEQKLALNEGIRRGGWFTYTELGNLSDVAFSWSVLAPILHNYILQVVAFSVTYTALLATVLSSSFIPKIFALTKTMLISGILHASSTNLLSSQSVDLSCNNNNSYTTTFDRIPKLNSNHQQDSSTEKIEAELLSLENILDTSTETVLANVLKLDSRLVSLKANTESSKQYNGYNSNYDINPGSGFLNIDNIKLSDTTTTTSNNFQYSAISKLLENWTETRRGRIANLWSSFCCSNQFPESSTYDTTSGFSSYMLIKV